MGRTYVTDVVAAALKAGRPVSRQAVHQWIWLGWLAPDDWEPYGPHSGRWRPYWEDTTGAKVLSSKSKQEVNP